MLRLNPHEPSEQQSQPQPASSAHVEKFFIFVILALIVGSIAWGLWAAKGYFGEKGFSLFTQEKASSLELVEESIVNVVCPEAGKPFDFSEEHVGGTGYVLNDSGKILTNFHIIASEEDPDKPMKLNEKGCFVLFPDSHSGYSNDTYIAKPIYYKFLSPQYDFAYLQIYDVYSEEGETYGDYPRTFPALAMDLCKMEELSRGDEVFALGYPEATEGYYLTLVKGIISAFSSYDTFYSSANLGFGGSGGVVIAPEHDCLAGIYGGLVYDDQISYGEVYSADSVLEFIEKSKNIDQKEEKEMKN